MTHDPGSRPLAETLSDDLLRIGAVTLSPGSPFTWASGLRSPVYCDNRMTLGHPDVRRRIAEGFRDAIVTHALAPDVIAGTATAGIPHAAWLADRLALPMAYVRSKPKEHGRSRQIEGPLPAGSRVVLVEDLVSTGMSSLAAVQALRDAGAAVAAVVAIFSYGLPSAGRAFAGDGVPLFVLTTFADLLAAAERTGRIDAAEAASLRAWHTDPQGWSDRITGGT